MLTFAPQNREAAQRRMHITDRNGEQGMLEVHRRGAARRISVCTAAVLAAMGAAMSGDAQPYRNPVYRASFRWRGLARRLGDKVTGARGVAHAGAGERVADAHLNRAMVLRCDHAAVDGPAHVGDREEVGHRDEARRTVHLHLGELDGVRGRIGDGSRVRRRGD